MYPRFACILFLCILCANAFGQGHLDLYTQRMLKNAPPDKTTINLFVRGDFRAVKEAVWQAKGNYKFGYGEYSSVTIPLTSLNAFLNSPAVRGVENGERELVPLSDTSIIVNNVLSVHNGDCLDTSYLGDGVIMGIIDYGIDFAHQDFQKSNGDTRILYLWDQNVTAINSPLPYNYGREWIKAEIDSGQCTHVEPGNAGHGTSVSGIAAGNGRSCNGRYVGVAPNSDMIVVAFNFSEPFIYGFMDAVDYVFKKADSLGRPCVINASMGAYWGSHDGGDPAALLVNSLLEEKNGRSLVCAAGNAGNLAFHLGYDVTADTSFTWFSYNPQFSDVYFDFWADTQDFQNVYFAIGTDNPATWQNVSTSPFFNVLDSFTFAINSGDTIAGYGYQQRDANNNFLGSVSIAIHLTRGRYNVEVNITGIQFPTYYWSLITKGSGRIDGWNSADQGLAIYSSDMVVTLPDSSIRPDITHYKLPDTNQNITSGFSCSERVISVGNFTNRKSYPDCDSNITVNAATPGEIFFTSSHGPTRRGLIKPDISATGDFTVTTGNSNVIAALMGGQRYKLAYCPNGCYYMRNGGTSMSSPVVAGIAALYLQRYPNANWKQVRDAILLTARVDSFTGAIPNNAYGYGKVSGCDAIMMDVVYGCTDTGAFNYNVDATVNDGSCIPRIYGCTDSTAFNYNHAANTDDSTCIPVIYGCMDSTAFNYNSAANTDDSTCIPVIYGCTDIDALNYDSTANTDDGSCYYVGIATVNNEHIKLAFIPNFFRNEAKIVYDIEALSPGKTSVRLTNIVGQQTDEIELPQGKGTILYHPVSQKPGIYFYHVISEGKVLLSGKLVIY